MGNVYAYIYTLQSKKGLICTIVRFLSYAQPIVFHGKIIDQSGRPVYSVKASLKWNDPLPDPPQSTTTFSDEEGLFSLNGVTGRILWLSLEKQDFYVSRSNRLDFQFSPYDRQVDAENPILFHLRKMGPGTDLVTSQHGVRDYESIIAPKDGTQAFLDFLNSNTGIKGQLIIMNIKPLDGKQRTDWSFMLSVPDGGLVEHHEEFPFEAPDTGYKSAVEFKFDKTSDNWVAGFKKDFYIVFGQPKKYGRIHVETDTYTSGARIHYAINPNGSRYLESKQ